MRHKIESVKTLENFILLIKFNNGMKKTYDIHNLYTIFSQFKIFESNKELFSQVQVDIGGYGIY